ncbi:hypothetical protein X975_10670, partial [Stegodyphus mimosarum]
YCKRYEIFLGVPDVYSYSTYTCFYHLTHLKYKNLIILTFPKPLDFLIPLHISVTFFLL